MTRFEKISTLPTLKQLALIVSDRVASIDIEVDFFLLQLITSAYHAQ